MQRRIQTPTDRRRTTGMKTECSDYRSVLYIAREHSPSWLFSGVFQSVCWLLKSAPYLLYRLSNGFNMRSRGLQQQQQHRSAPKQERPKNLVVRPALSMLQPNHPQRAFNQPSTAAGKHTLRDPISMPSNTTRLQVFAQFGVTVFRVFLVRIPLRLALSVMGIKLEEKHADLRRLGLRWAH